MQQWGDANAEKVAEIAMNRNENIVI